MAGPVPPFRSASSPNDVEDEPWDQRYSSAPPNTVVATENSMAPRYIATNTYNRQQLQQQQHSMGARNAEGEDLDDGDLPSLASRGYNVVTPTHSVVVPAAATASEPTGGRVVGGHKTTTRPLKPSTDKGLQTPSPTSGRRKFWGQMEQSEYGPSFDDEEVAEVVAKETRGSTQRRSSKSGGKDEDGPEDEMAARRPRGRSGGPSDLDQHIVLPSNSTMTSNRSPMKDYDTDNSVPTDVESQLTEEEEEDESRYEATFCGQTLNAIGDICGGGGLNMGGRSTSKENDRPPPVSTVDGSRVVRKSRSPSLRDESQQENTAIEVEFVEPVKPAAKPVVAEESGHGGTVDPQKKNAYLTAMAKKAKENFQIKKAKNQPPKVSRDIVPVEPASRLPVLHAMTSLIDVEESATDIASGLNAKGGAPDTDAKDVADVDSDYNSFNATEKRKFIKLINGGVPAGDATRYILEERSISRRDKDQEQKRSHAAMDRGENDHGQHKAAKVSARLPFWKRSNEAEAQPSGSQLREVSADPGDVPQENARDPDGEDERNAPTMEAILAEAQFPDGEETLEDILADAQFPDIEETDPLPPMEEDPGVQQETSVSDVDSVLFAKSGSHYYDAVRQEYDEEPSMSMDGGQRGLDFSKTLEIARAQRFFGVAKSKGKGFTALPNSPERRSASVPRQRLGIAGITSNPTGHHQLDDPSDDHNVASDVDVESELAGTLTVGTALSKLDDDDFGRELLELQAEDALEQIVFSTGNAARRGIEPEFTTPTASADEEDEEARAVVSRGGMGTQSFPVMDPSLTNPVPEGQLEGIHKDEGNESIAGEHLPSTLTTPKHQSMELPMKPSAALSPKPPDREIVSTSSNLDISMDTYFKSTTDAYSVAESVHQSDNVSIYTTGTTNTGATGYTQSSRVRRPGVAKTRLAKQKQIEQRVAKRGQGWHETIRSAAESAKRTWDPKRGWIDYEEPDIVSVAPLPVVKEKIRMDLDRSVLSHKGEESSSQDTSRNQSVVTVPFPDEWQKERDAMIESVSPNENVVAHASRGANDSDQNLPASNRESKSKGWVESMRLASASLAKEGKIWDPVHGWSSVTRGDTNVPNTVDFDAPSFDGSSTVVNASELDVRSRTRPANDDVGISNEENIPRENSANKLANFVLSYPEDDVMSAEDNQMEAYRDIEAVAANVSVAPSADLSATEYDDVHVTDAQLDATSADVKALVSESLSSSTSFGKADALEGSPLTHDNGKKLNNWIAKKTEMVPRGRSELSTEHSDLAVVSGNLGSRSEHVEHVGAATSRYEPHVTAHSIENSNTVLGRLGISPPGVDMHEYDAAPSIVNSVEFPLHDDMNIVDVVKEKVNERDMDLFSEDSKSPRNNRHRVAVSATDLAPVVSSVDRHVSSYESPDRIAATQRSASVVSADLSVATSRRGGGPIDTDEVDETWDSDDDERHSQGWLPNLSRGGKSGGADLSYVMPNAIPEDGDDHQHIKGWKDNGTISMTQSSRNASGHSSDAHSSALMKVTPLKRVPRLERSKRDTSPLSDRKVVDVGPSVRDEDPVAFVQPDFSPLRARDERGAENDQSHPTELPVSFDATALAEAVSSRTNAFADPASFISTSRAEYTQNVSTDKQIAPNRFSDSDALSPMGRIRQNALMSAADRHVLGGLSTPPGSNHGERSRHEKVSNEIHSPESPSVKDRLREWETRIEASYSTDAGESVEHARKLPNETLSPGGMEGWRSFIGKKVQAVSAAAIAAHKGMKSETQDVKQPDSRETSSRDHQAVVKRTQTDEDSLFEFVNKRGANRNEHVSLDISDLSPINVKDDLSEVDYAESGYGPTEEERRSSSFLQRLSECAAPIMSKTQAQGESLSSSGSFLKPTGSSMFMPTALCGNQDIVDEPDSVAETSYDSLNTAEKHRRSMSFGDEKPRSKSKSRDKVHSDTVRVSTSSVVSEDFGAKTAFLDSVAMKAAVSKKRRSRSTSRKQDRSGDSSVASGSTIHSEKWKSFLERKRAADPSPIRSRASSSDVSRAAEKYASQKVDEIMSKMATRSKTVTRSREVHRDINAASRGDSRTDQIRTRSTVKDAEDLAAARVEAMMAALSSSHLDEGEI